MIPNIGESWSGYMIRELIPQDVAALTGWPPAERALPDAARRSEERALKALENTIDDIQRELLAGEGRLVHGQGCFVLARLMPCASVPVGLFAFSHQHFNLAFLTHGERGRHLGSKCGAILVERVFTTTNEQELRTSRLSIAGDKLFQRLGFRPKGQGDPGRVMPRSDWRKKWRTKAEKWFTKS